MNLITLSWYIKSIRNYSKNCRQSYQNILCILFELISSNESFYYIESSTSSRIMNGEYDVPYDIRSIFNKMSIDKKEKISNDFINEMIDSSSIERLINDVKNFVMNSNITISIKEMILKENDCYKILSLILNIAIITDNRININKILFKNNNGILKLINGDIIAIGFNKKLTINNKIVVIPVDNDFTMSFKDADGLDVISKDTIHGKWLLRMNKLRIIPKIKYIKVDENINIGKCVVNKTEFYLLPISKLNKRYKAESGIEIVKSAIDALSLEYNISGQGIAMYVPLIGTGRSRTKLTLKDSLNLIKDAFINNQNGFFGEVNIVVNSKNITDLENL